MDRKTTIAKAVWHFFLLIGLITIGILFLPKIILLCMPFIIGGLIACAVSPMVKFFEEKIKMHRKAGSAIVICLSISLVVALIYFIASFLVGQGISLMNSLPEMMAEISSSTEGIVNYISSLISKLPDFIETAVRKEIGEADSYASGLFTKASEWAIAFVTNLVTNMPMAILSTVVAILSAYFFVSENITLVSLIQKYCPERLLELFLKITNGTKHAVGGYLIAQFKIEGCVYILLLLGFLILRVPFAWLVALGVAILDILPIFGTGTALVPWAIIEGLNGRFATAIGLLIIWGLSQLLRQFIQPKFVGNQVGLSEISTLVLMYAGFVLGGVVGMIFSVPIGIVVYSLYKEHVFDSVLGSFKDAFSLIRLSNNSPVKEKEEAEEESYEET